MPGEAQCTNAEKVPFTISPTTKSGLPAELDGPIALTVLSGDGTFTINADGRSGFLVSGTAVADTTYKFDGDADLGQGVVDISDTAVLHVTGELAQFLGVGFGAAVPK